MHTPEHERWYEPIALGDAARVPADVASEIQRCAECTHRIAEWRGARAAVEAAAREQRDVFARAREGGDVPGLERAERTLAELAAGSPRGSRQRSAWLALAAAILLGALAWMWLAPKRQSSHPSDVLGGAGFSALAMRSTATGSVRFTWSYPLEPHGSFRVSIRRADEPSAKAVLERDSLTECAWELSNDELARLPARFEWQVNAYDSSGKFQLASPVESGSRP